ncbi:MAG: glycosyltransferase family 4 protein [Verrucomicrobiota bacterium]
MKIALVIHSLQAGGAERACGLLAQGFLDQGREVTVITLSHTAPDFYALDARAQRIVLDLAQPSSHVFSALKNNIRRVCVLRKAILDTRASCVISFMHHTNIRCALALWGTSVKLIASEQIDPRFSSLSLMGKWLQRWVYKRLDGLVSGSFGVDHNFSWFPSSKRVVIYNPLPPIDDTYSRPSLMDASKKWVIAAGRFTHQKGFDYLIKMFSSLAGDFSDWNLIILGDGELRIYFESLIQEHDLRNRVFLPGNAQNIFAYFRSANLFVLPSRFEGFGNVLAEALACGLPAIAFDCPSGPSEIIRSETGGVLVSQGDVHAFACAMRRLMNDENERKRLAGHAPEAMRRFHLESIMRDWERFLSQLFKKRE